ncbi:uncharacterized protein LOC105688841 [Athalia rosae]|uniref:uncharacterized protein LOC105688841 n=1 Tax=Athalia rosae TaxID=37344 RepID=UPI002033A22F|nr:uncharacterized protein LOC105688841 [Athalia rosae]XP_012260853.2 uncharacterized protein LOC105688841 [Athalia rosae]
MMEQPEARPLIRDSDLALQPRTTPRYKVWLPLATQQLRLRNLIQVIGYNLTTEEPCETKRSFYYTLHRTTLSSPFYTSEPIDSVSPKWASLDVPILHTTGHSAASDIVLRVWRRVEVGDTTTDVVIQAHGLSLTGLVYLGTKLPSNLEDLLKDKSLIFYLQGGYFVPPCCCASPPELKKYLSVSVQATDVRDSYTVNKLCSLKSKMQALRQQSDSARALREQIAQGYETQMQVVYPRSTLNRLLQPKQASKEKKAASLRIRKELEVARFRTKLLDQERIRKAGEIRVLGQLHAGIVEENEDHGSDLMGRYRELNRDIERLREWRQCQTETKELYLHTTARLAHRQIQLISELGFIYPVSRTDDGRYTINNVHLPDSEELDSCNDTQVAVALGSVAHTTQMIANFLNVPTRYPIIHCASRSKVIDHITENIPDKDRQFPLFARGKDKLQFHYAVYLLNKNIAQLRWYCGLPTVDLRATLPNLASLISIKPHLPLEGTKRTFSGSSLDTDNSNSIKYKPPAPPPLPVISPFENIIFEKCHKQTRSIGRSKSIRCSLGSSLDQGLNNQEQLSALSNKTKRICKSAERAIDDTRLSLPNNTTVEGSDQTLNHSPMFESNYSQNGFQGKNHSPKNASLVDVLTSIESDIEITVPVSVSKRKGTSGSDLVESCSDGTRHRSSNSISSCEMALCVGQLDGEEIKCELDGGGETFIIENANNSFMEKRDRNSEVDGNPTSNKSEQQPTNFEPAPASRKPCPSTDYAIACASGIMEQKQRAGSICSAPDEYFLAEKIPWRKRYDSEPREVDFPESWKSSGQTTNSSEERLQYPECDQANSRSLVLTPTPRLRSSKESLEPEDSRASSEFIDSIRRSSETVFARTEALANKQTSFKVMRPRQ